MAGFYPVALWGNPRDNNIFPHERLGQWTLGRMGVSVTRSTVYAGRYCYGLTTVSVCLSITRW